MTIDELLTKAMSAEASIDSAYNTIDAIKAELNKGVSLAAGRAIIKSIYGDMHEGKKLLANLTTFDDQSNANMIKWANLPEPLVEKFFGRTDAAQSFLFDADEFISRTMGRVMSDIANADSTDTAKADFYNEFRKRTMSFIWAMTNSLGVSYEELSKAKCWSEVPGVQHIEDDGDYLFITDFLPSLKESFTTLLKSHVSSDIDEGDSTTSSIADMGYSLESYKADIQIVKLYAVYINSITCSPLE